MNFSNPAGNTAAAAGPYVPALLDLLGSRNPLEVMAELVPWLGTRLRGLAESTLRRPEAPGKWDQLQGLRTANLHPHDLVHRRQIDRILSSAP